MAREKKAMETESNESLQEEPVKKSGEISSAPLKEIVSDEKLKAVLGSRSYTKKVSEPSSSKTTQMRKSNFKPVGGFGLKNAQQRKKNKSNRSIGKRKEPTLAELIRGHHNM